MKNVILGWLAAVLLLPATSFAHDFRDRREGSRFGPDFRQRPWFETDRRGFWHLHRVPRRFQRGFRYFYHWHPAPRFDRFDHRWSRPWFPFER